MFLEILIARVLRKGLDSCFFFYFQNSYYIKFSQDEIPYVRK